MSSHNPRIFDRSRLAVNRKRAARHFYAHDFLLHHVAQELCGRLAVFNQNFERALCLGSSGGLLRQHLIKREQINHLIEADITPAFAPDVVLDEEQLALGAASCDLIISLWGLHHVNDLPGALVQIRHALTADGLFLAALPSGQTLTELRQALLIAETEIIGGALAHIHPFADLRDLGDLLQRAGMTLPVADSECLTIQYDTPQKLLADLRGMGEGNILTTRTRHSLRRQTLARAFEIYRALAPSEAGVKATFEICYLSARAPHSDQPKPLRPGSATTRLATALKTDEMDL